MDGPSARERTEGSTRTTRTGRLEESSCSLPRYIRRGRYCRCHAWCVVAIVPDRYGKEGGRASSAAGVAAACARVGLAGLPGGGRGAVGGAAAGGAAGGRARASRSRRGLELPRPRRTVRGVVAADPDDDDRPSAAVSKGGSDPANPAASTAADEAATTAAAADAAKVDRTGEATVTAARPVRRTDAGNDPASREDPPRLRAVQPAARRATRAEDSVARPRRGDRGE
jgi:hypothetical protein